MSSAFPATMRRLVEASLAGYVLLTLAALIIPPGSSLAAFAAQPLVSALFGPAAFILLGGSWSTVILASVVFLAPAGIAWAIWRYDPATGVGLFWTTVAVLAWPACGWFAWATHSF